MRQEVVGQPLDLRSQRLARKRDRMIRSAPLPGLLLPGYCPQTNPPRCGAIFRAYRGLIGLHVSIVGKSRDSGRASSNCGQTVPTPKVTRDTQSRDEHRSIHRQGDCSGAALRCVAFRCGHKMNIQSSWTSRGLRRIAGLQ